MKRITVGLLAFAAAVVAGSARADTPVAVTCNANGCANGFQIQAGVSFNLTVPKTIPVAECGCKTVSSTATADTYACTLSGPLNANQDCSNLHVRRSLTCAAGSPCELEEGDTLLTVTGMTKAPNIPAAVPVTCAPNGTAYLCTVGDVVADVMSKHAPTPTTTLNFAADGTVTAKTKTTTQEDGGGDASAPPSFLPEATWQQALHELNLPVGNHAVGNYYDYYHDKAVVFVNADGKPYFPMLDVIDEDDDLTVVMIDYSKRMAGKTLTVTGCKRPPVYPRIAPNSESEAGTRSAEQQDKLAIAFHSVGKCDGSSGGVFVSVGTSASSLNIPVNPLYRFAVGAALGVDFTMTRSFSSVTPAGDTVARIVQTDDIIGVSSLIYVSMYFAPRDFRKTTQYFWQRLELFAGVDPAKINTSLLIVGLGYEFVPGFSVLAGWRVLSQQPVLQEGSGLTVGSPIGNATIPTREQWEVGGPFIAVGINNFLLQAFK